MAESMRRITSANALLAERIARDPSSAFITTYDDATGERVELSSASFANWVAKTANLLVDELGAGAGDRVLLALPLHWQTLVWVQACWMVGIEVVLDEDAHDLVAAVTTRDRAIAGFEADTDELVALALLPLARPHPEPVTGYLDADRETPIHGDRFAGPKVAPDAWALDASTLAGGARRLTFHDIASTMADVATRHAFAPGTRIALVADAWSLGDGVLRALVLPLLVDGGVVLTRPTWPTADTWSARLDQERAIELIVRAGEP